MKKFLVILLVGLIACSDEPSVDCDGFSAEPSLIFKANKDDTLGVFFLNQSGNGDTLFSYDGDMISVPVDMSSDTMFYEIIGDSSLGTLILAYRLEQRLCSTSDELKQYFAEAQFTSKSTSNSISTVIDGAKLPLDTATGYASFLNQTLTDRYFEVGL